MVPQKRAKLIKNAYGTVLEIAAGCAQTLEHYIASQATTIILTEPGKIEYNVGMLSLTKKLDEQQELYSGEYSSISNLIHPKTQQPVQGWKFIFTKGSDVPLNIPIYYIQVDLAGASIATQVLTPNQKVDVVVSSFGVCYVCCSIHPLDYLRQLQVIFGPNKVDNQYELLMLEHGQTQHPDIIPAENIHVKRDGGVAFRHLFELMADSRLIIKDMVHVNETNQTEGPFNTFHIYRCEPNDQSQWVASQQ
eukprot:UN01348